MLFGYDDLCLSYGWENASVAACTEGPNSEWAACSAQHGCKTQEIACPSHAFLSAFHRNSLLGRSTGPTKLKLAVEPKCELRTRGKQEGEVRTASSMLCTAYWHGVVLSAVRHARHARM